MLIVNKVLTVPPALNDAGINKGINYEDILIRFELSGDNKLLIIRNVQNQPKWQEGDNIGHSIEENFALR